MEITKIFSLSFRKVSKILACPPLFMHVRDIWTTFNSIKFCLSFGKVAKIFTCPPPFLPVPDRRTVSNFHPWIMMAHLLQICWSRFDQLATVKSRSVIPGQAFWRPCRHLLRFASLPNIFLLPTTLAEEVMFLVTSVCPSGFVRATLCTTSTVKDNEIKILGRDK